jgi:hypothetical protein
MMNCKPHAPGNGTKSVSRRWIAPILFVFMVLPAITGCTSLGGRYLVEPLNSRDWVELTADQVIELMAAAGFEANQIISVGPGLRNALAISGGGQIVRRGTVYALFVAQNSQKIHVTTRGSGSFVYVATP